VILKKKIVFFLLLLPASLLSQDTTSINGEVPQSRADSIDNYERQIRELKKPYYIATKQREKFDSVRNMYRLLRSRSGNYRSFAFFTELFFSDYDVFNERMGDKGFSPMKSVSARIGFGQSVRWNRAMSDLLFIIGIPNKSKNSNGESIHSKMSSTVNYTIGYDVVNAERHALYPYVGLGTRLGKLEYSRKDSINTAFTDVTDAVVSQATAKSRFLTIGYNVGVEYDYSLFRANLYGGFIAFARAGVYNSFKKTERQELYERKFDPGIRHGTFAVAFGLKLAFKNER
jgi:hypothetical protein